MKKKFAQMLKDQDMYYFKNLIKDLFLIEVSEYNNYKFRRIFISHKLFKTLINIKNEGSFYKKFTDKELLKNIKIQKFSQSWINVYLDEDKIQRIINCHELEKIISNLELKIQKEKQNKRRL